MSTVVRRFLLILKNPLLPVARAVSLWIALTYDREKLHRLLGTMYCKPARGKFGSLVFGAVLARWFRTVYLREKDPDVREALKDVCMAGPGGVGWAEHYDRMPIVRSRRFDEEFPFFPTVDSVLENAADGAVVIHIGCSSGRETAYFAQRYPKLSFIGTDIDGPIVSRAERVYQRDNLLYKVARARDILLVTDDVQKLFILSHGSLQYVQPEHLEMMFKSLRNCPDATIIVCEPWREDGPSVGRHSRWRGNFSFSHDYRLYSEQAGLETMSFRTVQTVHDPNSRLFKNRLYILVSKVPGL
ncbi:MAG: class I SAM-dependent methyltransferase [Magnetococcales bacterium]|nr:class I SAM-dependent methyltransferase [Magnetococcales bacterium]